LLNHKKLQYKGTKNTQLLTSWQRKCEQLKVSPMSHTEAAAAASCPAWEPSGSRSRLPGHGQWPFPGFGFPRPHPAVLNCSCPYALFEYEPTPLAQMYLTKASSVTSIFPSKCKARNRKGKKTQTPGFQNTLDQAGENQMSGHTSTKTF